MHRVFRSRIEEVEDVETDVSFATYLSKTLRRKLESGVELPSLNYK